MRLSVHCQSPELQQPARAGKVGASGPQAQRHGTDFTDRFPKIAADAVENLRVRSCVLDDGCSGRKARSMDDRNTDGLFGNLSVLANVTAGSLGKFACAGIMRLKNERRTASEMLDRLRLVARSLDAPVRVLSGGNQQKTLFARALLCRPQLLICDEPTRGVDVGAREQIYSILIDLAGRGIGVIVISSELKELLAICHRLLVVRDGSLYEELEPSISEHDLAMIAAGFRGRTHGRRHRRAPRDARGGADGLHPRQRRGQSGKHRPLLARGAKLEYNLIELAPVCGRLAKLSTRAICRASRTEEDQ